MPDGMPAIFCHFSHFVEDSVRGSLRSRLVLGSQNRLLVLHPTRGRVCIYIYREREIRMRRTVKKISLKFESTSS